MKAIHITPKTNGYEIVDLIANKVSRKNQLAYIKKDGKEYMTGGLLFVNDVKIKNLFDSIDSNKLYDFARKLKETPFEKSYLED